MNLKKNILSFKKKYFVDFNNIDSSQKKLQENLEENKEETFKPIQAESKNKETYKDDNTRSKLVKKTIRR